MYKDTINSQAKEIIGDILREGKVGRSAKILEMLPEILDSVEIDKRQILRCYEKDLKKKPGIFGVKFVNPNDAVRSLGAEIQAQGNVSSNEEQDVFLRLNKDMLRVSVQKMTDKLSGYEKSEMSNFRDQVQTQNEAIKELDKVSNNFNQLNAEYNNLISVVVQRSQYMLCVAGRENISDNLFANQIIELLEDFDMKAVWSAENTSFKESQLFTIYKCTNDSIRKSTPAIIQDDKVIAKGTKYVVQSD